MKKLSKKLLALSLAALMAAGTLVGCGAKEKESSEGDSFKVALLVSGLLGDKSFYDGANSAMPLLEKELGAETKVVEMGLDSTKWYPTLVDYCEKDYDLILTISATIDDALFEVAELYPDQKFINLDTPTTELPDNVYALSTKANEMSFLAGVVGALKAEELGEDTIGFIGGLDVAGINEFLVGYIDGAQYINPDIKVNTSYVGSFTDSAKGKENAIGMYNTGLSIIYAAAGQSGLGVIDAAKELGKYVIGVDSDQALALKDSNPEKAEVIITSAMKLTPEYTLEAVKRFVNDDVTYGTNDILGLVEGGVGIAKNEFYEKNLSEENRTIVEEVEGKVRAGEVTVIKTIGMPADELNKIRESVRP